MITCEICKIAYSGEDEQEVMEAHKQFWHNPWKTHKIIDAINEASKQ